MAAGSFYVTGSGQLTALQRRLNAVGRTDWRENLNRRIRHAAQPVKDDLVRTMLGLPIHGQGGRGGGGPSPNTRPLRVTLAAAIRLSVPTGGGTRIWIDKGRLPPDLRTMPRNLNSGHWRHPTFGNKRRGGWADQYSKAGWWDATIRPHTPRMTAQVARVLNDVERRLGG